MDSCCKGIYGLAASLELKYVLVVPTEQATMLHGELLRRGVPERLIYEVDPNRRPRPQKSTNCGPAAEASSSGGRTHGQEKRFMPGSIRLGTYAAGGQQYNVGLRWGSVWISMVDRAPGADGGGASEVTVADGGGASEVSPVAGSSRSVEGPPVVDHGMAAVPVPKENSCMTMNMPMESDGGRETDDDNITVLGGDCENGNDERNLGNGGRHCNSSSMLCEDCKQWLLKEYFGDRLQDEASDLTGQHACIYRRIVDRLFVVTVTESGGAGDDEDDDEADDEDAAACCGTTTADDGVVERISTPTSRTEREQPFAGPTTPSQPAPPMEHSTTPSVPESPGKEDQVDQAAKKVGKPKSKKKSFFGNFCKSNKKTKTD
ncbi:unnamed protein product [Macrosiphum euphorbiae]|uniref:Uncharacterized protein n=2 Tax=Macrosiphum euphorbiae TaxID=13131 RepID=A0AAV0WMX1_9HEMI|nr:unnamed protein product [Macrosiphum euphorbiae]